MRLSTQERSAIKAAFNGFEGEVYLFGSRLDHKHQGGDIDILIKPTASRVNRMKLTERIQKKFLNQLEQSLDIVVYDQSNPFCQEIIKHAHRFDLASL